MAPQQPKHEKIANVTANTFAGAVSAYTIATSIGTYLDAKKMTKVGGKFVDNLLPATEKFFKSRNGAIITGASLLVGALMGRMGAKAKNNAYAEAVNAAENAHGQLAQAAAIIEHQEAEIQNLKQEGAGARKSFAEQVKASREESAELGI
jgi:predicted transcriptional regulator